MTAKTYDRLKRHGGKGYSGMRVGGFHKWRYEEAEWRERKITPDEWEIFYQTPKHRAAKAPKESGAPVGTEYNWLIVSHQRVDKLDANTYMTYMEGKKFKVAHKRASKDKWSATEKTQRKHVIEYLEQVIDELKRAPESEAVPYSVGEHRRIYGLALRTKAELYDMAKEYEVPSSSKMSREELLHTVEEKLENGAEKSAGNGQAKAKRGDGLKQLQNKTKSDLYRLASERNIGGRSDMNKAELLSALKQEFARGGQFA